MTDAELSKRLEVEAERDIAHMEIERLRTALGAVQGWLDTLPNAAGIPGFPKDTVDAAMLPIGEQTVAEK